MIWDNREAAISGDRAPQALGYNRAHGNALRALQCSNDLQPNCLTGVLSRALDREQTEILRGLA